MRLIAIQGNICADSSLSQTCLSLMDQMGHAVERQYWGFAFLPDARRDYTRDALPLLALKVAYRLKVTTPQLLRLLAARVTPRVRQGDVTWIWPQSTPEFVAGLRRRQALVVSERINTCMPTFRRSVRAAYAHLSWPVPFDWRDDDAPSREEAAIVHASDAIFSPSQLVRESLIETGYPESRILDSSYGWNPERMKGTGVPALPPSDKPRFVFVGLDSVRKGLPVLLRAWRDAGVAGELVIVGTVDREVEAGCAAELALPSVRRIGRVSGLENLADIYRSCDVFVLPTHEEGSPQVTYQAAGCGLALLVSPMGAGGAFRADIDAVVASPFEHDAWVDALRRYANDLPFRRAMAAAASARAQEFTWQKVAARRLESLRRIA